MQLTEGTLFHDRYTLVRLIGRGGFSEVWLAHDKYTGLELALKVYAPNGGTDDTSIAIFSDEIRRVYNLSHPNLLKPQHFAVCEGMPYIVMPYCANGSVVKQIGKMSEAEIWTLLHDVATGLAYLHEQHIVHQDIKPDNILQAADGHYLITDFGISARTRTTLTKTQAISNTSAGTSAYMAPERFGSKPAPTFASDIWALGATLFELIEGYVPFGDGALPAGLLQKNGAEIPEMKAQVSDTLKRTVCQMLAPNAWDRPTAETLATWAANPAVLHFSGVTDAPKTATDRPTTPLSAERDTVIFEQHTQHNTPHTTTPPQKSSKVWVCFLELLIVLIGGIVCVTKIYDDYQWEKTYKESLTTNHRDAVSEFDKQIQNATIDNIAALEKAAENLTSIKEYEDDSKFEGEKVYREKQEALERKKNSLCDEAIYEGKQKYNAGNYQKAKELFEYAQNECGSNYGNAQSWIDKCNEALGAPLFEQIAPV